VDPLASGWIPAVVTVYMRARGTRYGWRHARIGPGVVGIAQQTGAFSRVQSGKLRIRGAAGLQLAELLYRRCWGRAAVGVALLPAVTAIIAVVRNHRLWCHERRQTRERVELWSLVARSWGDVSELA
jgi:hypothetical protein